MGAFCVFGISKSLCRSKAEKKVPTVVGIGKDAHRLSITEWAQEVRKASEDMFLTIDKPAKISPEFDAPQFARDWLAVAPAEVRLARIMVRQPKIDEAGKPIMRKGAPVMTWAQYEGASA